MKEEIVKIEKGKYRTIVTLRFDKEGYPISNQLEVEAILENQHQKKQLNQLIDQAVANRDFRAAESLQKQLDSLT